MLRLFNHLPKRKGQSLDGLWQFAIDPGRQGLENGWHHGLSSNGRKVVVPSCWNHDLELYHYEGLAWYSTTFTTNCETAQLVFHAITGQAEIYVDGEHVVSHYGGFTPFDIVLKKLTPGRHVLAVSVDNTHDTLNTIPLARVDWFHYGGIIRSVELYELHDAWIQSHRIDYTLNESLTSAALSIAMQIENLHPDTKTEMLRVLMGDVVLYEKEVRLNGITNIQLDKINIENIALWGIGQPNLCEITLDIGSDAVTERIGFRDIRVSGQSILLNGEEIYLKGVNRHEDHPDWGFAVPFKLNKKDMDIIKQLGCNTIRGSHYPNSEAFLDLCDQEGILFWEEIPLWGYPEEALQNQLVHDRAETMLQEMILRDYHHPSIFVWGLHNEIDTRTQAGLKLTERLAKKARSLDKSRPITFATHHPLDDICLPYADIISVNKYNGWYEGDLPSWEEFLVKLEERLISIGQHSKPVIMSEFGAGGIYGETSFEAPKWTENYQEKYLTYTLDLFYKHPKIVGTYIWQYCDIRTAREMELHRPRSFNNKGIVNEYRRPKMAYWAVQKLYHDM